MHPFEVLSNTNHMQTSDSESTMGIKTKLCETVTDEMYGV